MAVRTGTSLEESLFGTNGDDTITGQGGRDVIQGNDGDDLLSGAGQIYGNDGDDTFSSIRFHTDHWIASDNVSSSPSYHSYIRLAEGDDTFIFSDHDEIYGSSIVWIAEADLGDGDDLAIVASGNTGMRLQAGFGEDTVYLLSEAGARVQLGEGFVYSDDQRDEVHWDSNGLDAEIFGFGAEDVLYIYGSDLTYEELTLRTTLVNPGGEDIIITMPDETIIEISYGHAGNYEAGVSFTEANTGFLERDQVVFVDRDLSVSTTQGLVELSTEPENVRFFSGADERIRVRNSDDVVLAGFGGDTVRGTGRDDFIYGEAGNDVIKGRGGSDQIYGDHGDDRLIGNGGRDSLFSGAGNDTILAGGGSDFIHVDRGENRVIAGAGSDTVFLAQSFSQYSDSTLDLALGRGKDTIDMHYSASGVVIVRDFQFRKDKFDLSDAWTSNIDEDRRLSYLEDSLERSYELEDTNNEFGVSGVVFSVSGLEIVLQGAGLGQLGLDHFDII